MKKTIILILLSLFCTAVLAQPVQKKIAALKIAEPPKIDGALNDPCWKNAEVATDFIESKPVAGTHEKLDERTEVKIVYDDNAIYIGARMYERSPDNIAREIATRDSLGNADLIGIVFDTYHDGINGSGFFVTAANSQFDAKYSPGANGSVEDANWNAVWTSNVKVDEKGWTAEIRIPYSALRFTKKDVQVWGMNMIRQRRFSQKQLSWNELDPKVKGLMNQAGLLTGLEKISPPVRLGFYPYFSTKVNHYPYNTAGIKNTTVKVNGGMDVKYGINESFTLDLTLVPDFGQVQSDNKILNLTPFEVKYNENRPFFTEGTELFNKGNLFYSRRVGGMPVNYNNAYANLNPGEEVISNPSETKLLNAIKISGRTSKGLGIGLFNAITNTTYATIEDAAGNNRVVQTSPVANYNILVFDQNLKNNSAITLINTNVTRFGKNSSADVGGLVYNLNNKANSYNLSGYGMISNIYGPERNTETGYSYQLSGGKSSGNFTWNLSEIMVDSKYDPNDLGILLNNNYLDHEALLKYNNYVPTKYFNSWGVSADIYYSRRVNPAAYQRFSDDLSAYANLKNLWRIDVTARRRYASNDFYEPRVADRYFRLDGISMAGFSIETNQAKRLWVGLTYINHWINNGYGGTIGEGQLFYQFRLNNKIAVSQTIAYTPQDNNTGFSTLSTSGNPIFALRDVQTVENIVNLKYTFTSIMGFYLRVRHYWSKLNNKQFFDLSRDGYLTPTVATDFEGKDQNANIWNIDLNYVWQFRPGSELGVAWKVSSATATNLANGNYFNNLSDTFNQPQNNNISLKVLYYVDYQDLKKRRKR